MKILLHIGSPKAGSSFLQSACARAREELASNGIYFPVGTPHDESCMQRGRISAGNALHLARYLKAGEWSKADSWLKEAIDAALARSCETLLLSSEWLLGSAAESGRLEKLAVILRSHGASRIELLMIMRDPPGQLISLYKHRAKAGSVPPIDQWVTKGYELPDRLRRLRHEVDASGVDLIVRAYGKEPGALERIFFEDWLKTAVPVQAQGAIVNPSLSLSELVMLRRLRAHHAGLVPILYERLLVVAPTSKVEGRAMKDFAQQVAMNSVAEHADEWRIWNGMLPAAERFQIPAAGPAPGEEPSSLELSDLQLGAVMELLADATRPRLIAQLFWQIRLRPLLSRIKQVLFPWHTRR